MSRRAPTSTLFPNATLFRSPELDALADYVMLLRSPAADHPVAGDVSAGEQYFAGKGACTTCHMVAGRGGILGPELSNLARTRKLPQIERALLHAGSPAVPASRGT